MTQPDDPGPCGDATTERLATQAEVLASRASIMRAVRAFYPAWPVHTAAAPQPVPGILAAIGPQEQKRTEVDVSRPLSSSVPFCSPLSSSVPGRLPTAAELTDNATYAAMLDVMRQAEVMRREAWVRPCCAVCGQPVATPTVADGVAFHPACASCALERAFGA